MALSATPAHYPGTVRLNRAIRLFAWLNLVVQIGIIVTGGAVRLTGSGLGCSTWPNCEPGQFTPQIHGATDLHGAIEFGNRVLAAIVLTVAAVLAVLLVIRWRRSPREPRAAHWIAIGIVAGVIGQAVLGGMTVWFELHPALVSSHFLISGLLVTVSTYLVVRLREGDAPPRGLAASGLRACLPIAVVLALLCAVLVVLGVIVTGAGPHSGDADVGYRFAVDPAAVARVHAASAWLFTATVVALLVVLLRARPADDDGSGGAELRRARTRVWVLLGITLAQGLIGYLQYFTGLPELLVGLHLFGAAVLIAATTFAITGLRVRTPTSATAPSLPISSLPTTDSAN